MPTAAASTKANQSSITSRLHAAAAFCHPRKQEHIAALKIVAVALAIGHSEQAIVRMLKQVGQKHPRTYSRALRMQVASILQGDRAMMLRRIREHISYLM